MIGVYPGDGGKEGGEGRVVSYTYQYSSITATTT